MITDSEKFVEIQGLLALSNIPSADCIKINDLILKLSKENQKSKDQQKEFISWLEDKMNELLKEYGNYVYDDYSEEKGKYDTYIEILQKYKEIIGVLDGKEN